MASTPFPASPTTRRSASWLMMLATPVRSSAWSSTTSTVALTGSPAVESTGNMDPRRQRGRLPRQHHFGAAARSGDDGERRADACGAFLHAGHPEARGGLLA